MKYKLLVLDVDGTLLNNEKEISKRTLASLLKVQKYWNWVIMEVLLFLTTVVR